MKYLWVFAFFLGANQVFPIKVSQMSKIDLLEQNNDIVLKNDELALVEKFWSMVQEDIPHEIMLDLCHHKSIGFRGNYSRDMTQDERDFIKKHLQTLYVLSFLESLNLDHLGLDVLPENFDQLTALRCLSLIKNNFTSIPEFVQRKLDARVSFDFMVEDNPIADKETVKAYRRAMGNILPEKKWSETIHHMPWSRRFVARIGAHVALKPDQFNMKFFYLGIIQAATMYHNTHDLLDKKNPQAIQESKTFEQLRYGFAHITPIDFAKYVIEHGHELWSKQDFNARLLKYLCHTHRISMIALKNENLGTLDLKEVFGCEKYFTGDVTKDLAAAIPTVDGILVFLESVGLIENYLVENFPQEQRLAFDQFYAAVDYYIPHLILEDMVVYTSLGVRDNIPRVLTKAEKKWVTDYLFNLPKLTFLKSMNLCDQGLYNLPDDFSAFKKLEELHLDGNIFKEMPSCLLHMNEKATVYVSRTKIPEENIDQFFKNFSKNLKERRRASCLPSKLEVKKLQWSPLLLSRAGVPELGLFPKDKALPREAMNTLLQDRLSALCDQYDAMLESDEKEHALETSKNIQTLIKHIAYHQIVVDDATRKKLSLYFIGLLSGLAAKQVEITKKISLQETLSEADQQPITALSWQQVEEESLCQLLYLFTPGQFIGFLSEIENLVEVPSGLNKKKKEDRDIIKTKTLEFQDKCLSLFQALSWHLVNKGLAITYARTLHEDTQEMLSTREFVGWEKYMTELPCQGFKGWFTPLGLAEFLHAFGLVE